MSHLPVLTEDDLPTFDGIGDSTPVEAPSVPRSSLDELDRWVRDRTATLMAQQPWEPVSSSAARAVAELGALYLQGFVDRAAYSAWMARVTTRRATTPHPDPNQLALFGEAP